MTDPKAPPPGFVPATSRGRFTREVAELWERPEGSSFVRGIRVEDRHLNAAGITHGGFLCTIMDTTFGSAVRHDLDGRMGFTVRLVTDFLSPAKRGDWLEGRARVVRATSTLAFLEGELTVGSRTVMAGKAVFRLHDARQSARLAQQAEKIPGE
jgi:uncharacterized protein (TIGR00369 family)